MRIVLMVFLMFLVGMVSFSMAAEPDQHCFEWTKSPVLSGETVNGVDGYRIYRDPSTDKEFLFPDVLQDGACVEDRCTYCVPNIADGLNHRYVGTVFDASGESDYSTPADIIIPTIKSVVPPVGQGLQPPGKFITIIVPVESVTVN